MQKLLLASTALVASAAIASAADMDGGITFEGYAGMGVGGFEGLEIEESDDDSDITYSLISDFDLAIIFSGTTSSGLTFGAAVELDDFIDGGDGVSSPFSQGGESVFISGAFGTFTVGDIDGAKDWAMDEAVILGSLNDDEEHLGYNGNNELDGFGIGDAEFDGQIARYEYTISDFEVAASLELEDVSDDANVMLGFGMKYAGSFGGTDIGFGAGVQGATDGYMVDTDGDGDTDMVDSPLAYGMSLTAELASGLRGEFNYSGFRDVYDDSFGDIDSFDESDENNEAIVVVPGGAVELDNHFGVAVGYESGAFAVSTNYGRFNSEDGHIEGIGVNGAYDLGGGASFVGAYGYSRVDLDDIDFEDDDFQTFSLGVQMEF